jgi:hypothetical protein
MKVDLFHVIRHLARLNTRAGLISFSTDYRRGLRR